MAVGGDAGQHHRIILAKTPWLENMGLRLPEPYGKLDRSAGIVWMLPVSDLLYAGKSTRLRFSRVNIYTIGQLAQAPLDYIQTYLDKT